MALKQEYGSIEVTDYELLLWPFNERTQMKINAVISENLSDAKPEKYESSVVYKTPNTRIAFVAVRIPYQREKTLVHVTRTANYQTEDQEKTNIKTLLKKIMKDIITGSEGAGTNII